MRPKIFFIILNDLIPNLTEMVEGNQPIAAWPTHGLQKLESVIAASMVARKYLFIWDKQGSVATFMQYKG